MSRPAASSAKLGALSPAAIAAIGTGAVAALSGGACLLFRSLRAKRARANPKLQLDLAGQIAALQEIYPRLCKEFIADVKQNYAFPEFALQRLQRLFDYTILGGKYYRATLVLNTMQKLAHESGRDIDQVWEQGLVMGWCIEIVRDTNHTQSTHMRRRNETAH